MRDTGGSRGAGDEGGGAGGPRQPARPSPAGGAEPGPTGTGFWRTHGLLGIITAVTAAIAAVTVAVIGLQASRSADPAKAPVESNQQRQDESTVQGPPQDQGTGSTSRPTAVGVRISLSPTAGPPGTNIIVAVQGLDPDTTYVLTLDTSSRYDSVTAGRTDAEGDIRARITVKPGTPRGRHEVTVQTTPALNFITAADFEVK
jgi:hypothetical protein